MYMICFCTNCIQLFSSLCSFLCFAFICLKEATDMQKGKIMAAEKANTSNKRSSIREKKMALQQDVRLLSSYLLLNLILFSVVFIVYVVKILPNFRWIS